MEDLKFHAISKLCLVGLLNSLYVPFVGEWTLLCTYLIFDTNLPEFDYQGKYYAICIDLERYLVDSYCMIYYHAQM